MTRSPSVVGRRAWLAFAATAACGAPTEEERGAPKTDAAASGTSEQRETAASSSVSTAPPDARASTLWQLDSVPRLALGALPTPVDSAPALARAAGLGELWIKRDDRSSAVFGGSKVRKLERLLGEARGLGRRHVVTFGGVGSNHAVATAAFGVSQGFRVTVQLAAQPTSESVARHLAACISFGAEVESVPGVADAFRRAERSASRAQEAKRPYVIAPGGTSDVGNLSMVDAAIELRGQIDRDELPEPDVIVMAMGTMGSAVGLAFGLRAVGLSSSVLAVRCSSPSTSSRPAFARLSTSFAAYLTSKGAPADLIPAAVELDDTALGRGYGIPTPQAERAILLAKEHADIDLESTYTGKALAAVLARASALRAKRVLFWATQPAPLAIDPASVDEASVPLALRRYLRA